MSFDKLARYRVNALRPLVGTVLPAKAMAWGLMASGLMASGATLASEVDLPSGSEATNIAKHLKLTVRPMGVAHPWTYRIHNTGSRAIEIVDEAAHFWISVTAPGALKAVDCNLPRQLHSHVEQQEVWVNLAPGEYVDRNFDPRFFCFTATGRTKLVSGALIQPHFGWHAVSGEHTRQKNATDPRQLWAYTRLAAVPQAEAPSPPDHPTAVQAAKVLASNWPNLVGPGVLLNESYSVWDPPSAVPLTVSSRLPALDPGGAQMPLSLTLLAGSDVTRARSVTVTVEVRNNSTSPQVLPIRQETVEYQISGPSGAFVCPAATTAQQVSDESSITIKPGASRVFTTLLAEVCPHSALALPGLYQVAASLAFQNNRAEPSDGFRPIKSTLQTRRPVLVRLAQGATPLPSRQLGRVLTPTAPSTTKTFREPPRPTKRNIPGRNVKIPKVDLLE